MKHRIVTAAQMKEIERAGDAHGLPYLQMMENAGLAAYAELQKQFPHSGRLLVVCGKGNNGGDGFVIARTAAKDGWSVTVLLAEGEPKTADATRNFERLHSLPVHICTDCSVLETQHFDAAVDALYGTGFHGELRPSGLAACGLIRRLHKSGAFVLAVDLPSGINTDTGEVAEGAAHADLTVTFDSYKPLHIAERRTLMQEKLSALVRTQAMQLFRQQGLHFTMQQVAEPLHISKKTIYTVYPSKEALLLDMVDHAFADIHRCKQEILAGSGTLQEKLRAVIIAMPTEYAALDLRQMKELDEKYPVVAARVRSQLENGWEPTMALLEQAVAEGVMRPVSLPVLRQMITASIESFLADRSLAESGVQYVAVLEEMISILLEGVLPR